MVADEGVTQDFDARVVRNSASPSGFQMIGRVTPAPSAATVRTVRWVAKVVG